VTQLAFWPNDVNNCPRALSRSQRHRQISVLECGWGPEMIGAARLNLQPNDALWILTGLTVIAVFLSR
jgi:hypothetical protein